MVLGILVKFTIDAIDENKVSQMENPEMEQPNGNMKNQMGGNSTSIIYSGIEEIKQDATIEIGEYSSETAY